MSAPRTIALWLAVLLASGPLAGCGPEPAQAEGGPTKIVLWHAYRAEEEVALVEAVERFNETRPDIRVEAQKIPYQAFADKLTTAIPRDNGPDLFIFAHDRIGSWADADIIEPISIWATEDMLGGYIRSTVLSLVYKKALYGLPLTFKSVALFYNKKLIPEPPKTDLEMIVQARALTDPAQKRYGLAYINTQLYFTAPFVHGFGGQILDIEGELHLSDPGTVKGMQFCQDLLHKHKVVPADVDGAVVTNLFNSGRAAMVINGPWFIGEIGEGVDWGVARLPTVVETGKPMAPYFGSEAVMMSRRSRHKRETFEVMTFLTSGEGSRIRMTTGGQASAWLETWSEVEASEVQKIFRDQIEVAVGMPSLPSMRFVWGPTDQAIQRIVKNEADPAEELKGAQDRIEASR